PTRRSSDLARARGARPGAAPRRRRRLDVHRAGLGRARVRRHRPRPDERGAARLPAAAPGGDRVGAAGDPRSLTFEVFRQERKGQPFQHAGSLDAPDAAFAEAFAREQFGRRGESVALWLVPREAIREVDEWADEFDLKYRRVD